MSDSGSDSDEAPVAGSRLAQMKEAWVQSRKRFHPPPRPAAPAAPVLPPGQHEVRNWPVLDLGIVPKVDRASWSLTVDGLVANPLVWRWEHFAGQPVFRDVSDMHCVTSWSRFNNVWEGVSTRHLSALVQPRPEARHVLCHSLDGYTTNLRREVFEDEDVLLACRWEGEPLPLKHGGPVRLVVPKFYLWKSAKWICRITYLPHDQRGYWEERGYHNEADPWREQRYSDD